MKASLKAHLSAFSNAFLPGNYGWKRALRNIPPIRSGVTLVYAPINTTQGFECFSSVSHMYDILASSGDDPEIYHIRIPVEGEDPYQHFLLGIKDKNNTILVDFTPFGKLLGIHPVKTFDKDGFDRFRTLFTLTMHNEGVDQQDSAPSFVFPPQGKKMFFPLGVHGSADHIVLTEFCMNKILSCAKMVLRVSCLSFDQNRNRLMRLGMISFAVNLGLENPVKADFDQEMGELSRRWGISKTQKGMDDQIEQIFMRAIRADWDAFAKLVNDINILFQ